MFDGGGGGGGGGGPLPSVAGRMVASFCRGPGGVVEVGVGAEHDLVDDRAVLALLDADGVRAVGGEVDVDARAMPQPLSPQPQP